MHRDYRQVHTRMLSQSKLSLVHSLLPLCRTQYKTNEYNMQQFHSHELMQVVSIQANYFLNPLLNHWNATQYIIVYVVDEV